MDLFSFGENWYSFVKTINQENIDSSKRDLVEWIGEEKIRNKSVLDIGSGSGLHSLCFYLLGARKIVSFDYDDKSVASTAYLKNKYNGDDRWKVGQGSILDDAYVQGLDKFDIVYSWGVLHHTGDMWKAIKNAAGLVKENGLFYLTIYAKGPSYENHLAVKLKYNRSNYWMRKAMVWKRIWKRKMKPRLLRAENPFAWNVKKSRGMDTYHDIVDWLGGYPYEVAYENEISSFLEKSEFRLEKKVLADEGACHFLLYRKT